MTMTETLEFPPIEAPAAPLAPASIKSAVLAQFADAERTVTALADKYRRVAYDCTTTKGMAAAAPKAPDSEMTAAWSLPKTEPALPPIEAPAAEPGALEPTITIGDINTRLGFLVTADLVIGLGFVRQVRIGRGVHFLASEWPRLCDALTAHIKAKREAY